MANPSAAPMPQASTTHFGPIEYEEDAPLEFPAGLPAFDEERRFLALEQPATAPVVFLQSLTRPDLVFITLPVLVVDPDYRLTIAEEDIQALGLAADRQPEIGGDILCLAVITVTEGGPPTANLMAPIIVNLATRRALQAIRPEPGYSHQHVLPTAPTEEPCC